MNISLHCPATCVILSHTNDGFGEFDETEGYDSRSQQVMRVKKRLAASANSASSSGAVRRWFCATNSCRILRRTDLDPESHSCNNDVSRDTATSCFDEVMTSVYTALDDYTLKRAVADHAAAAV